MIDQDHAQGDEEVDPDRGNADTVGLDRVIGVVEANPEIENDVDLDLETGLGPRIGEREEGVVRMVEKLRTENISVIIREL